MVTLQARNTCAAVVITTYNPGQKSLGQYYNMHIFLSFLGSLLKQCIIFEMENAPETQKCPKTFVHDCRLDRIIVLHENEKLTRTGSEQLLRENNPL